MSVLTNSGGGGGGVGGETPLLTLEQEEVRAVP